MIPDSEVQLEVERKISLGVGIIVGSICTTVGAALLPTSLLYLVPVIVSGTAFVMLLVYFWGFSPEEREVYR